MTIAGTDIGESSDEAVLLDYLRARDVACPLCGYNLRGLTAGRCPECGRELQLSVGLVEPRIGAWVTCLVAVTAAGGMGLMAILSIARHGWEVVFAPGGAVQVVTISYFLVTAVVVPALIVLRRRYRRLSQTAQWALAGVAAALTALAFAVLIAGQ
ncbi:MAG: hypothetical protein WBD40_22300 [Tepidisphaeraceae bacterium]